MKNLNGLRLALLIFAATINHSAFAQFQPIASLTTGVDSDLSPLN